MVNAFSVPANRLFAPGKAVFIKSFQQKRHAKTQGFRRGAKTSLRSYIFPFVTLRSGA